MVLQNALNNENLNVAKNGSLVEQLTEQINFGPGVSVTKDSDGFITAAFDANENFNRVFADNTDLTVSLPTNYVAVSTTNTRVTITLYEGSEGDRITIKDEGGKARLRPITVNPGGTDLIEDETEAKLAINRIGLNIVFTNGVWRAV